MAVALRDLGYCGGERLYQHVRQQHVWSGLKQDCLEYSARSLPRQREGALFKPPPYLYPTERPFGPFRLWCVDTIVRLTPSAPDGSQDVVVAVDPFTRWVEVGRVPNLDSHQTALWFHEQIVCRYGVPVVVRSDRGTEYRGEFDAYLRRQGIQHRLISTAHPRANGLVER